MLGLYLSMIDERNDQFSFEEIYQKFHKDILRRVGGILHKQEDRKDAMQETWLSVLKNIKKLQGKDELSIKAYIMRIARNQAITILRKKRKEELMLESVDFLELADDTALFDICESEGVSNVLRCIKMLSEAQRDVLIMYYFHHHTLKEIAALMGISETAVASRWTRGRAKLMELLLKEGYHE